MSNKTLLNRVFNQLLEELTPQKLIAESCQLDGNMLTVLGKRYDLDKYKNIYLRTGQIGYVKLVWNGKKYTENQIYKLENSKQIFTDDVLKQLEPHFKETFDYGDGGSMDDLANQVENIEPDGDETTPL